MSNFNFSNDDKLSMVILQNLAIIHAMQELENKVDELEDKVDELEIRLIETEQHIKILGKKISELNFQKKRNKTVANAD